MGINLGGRPQLIDMEKIVETALLLGLNNLSMNAVARELGVSTTALYRYVKSRDALIDACIDEFCAKIEMPSADLKWREYLQSLSRSFRDAFKAMPGISAYGMKIGPTTSAAFAIVDRSLGVLMRDGFNEKEAMSAFSIVIDHACTDVYKYEVHTTPKAHDEDGGGYKVLLLEEQELTDTPHLAKALSVVMSDFSEASYEESYELELAWLIAGIRPGDT